MATNESGGTGNGSDMGGGEVASKQCNLLQLYMKDVSFEAPGVPGILFGHEQPNLKFDLSTEYNLGMEASGTLGDVYAVLVRVTVEASAGDKVLFLIEVNQGGLFEIQGYGEDERDFVLRTKAPEALYPYARELLSSLVGRAGFPRLNLKAINFESRYSAAMQEYYDSAQGAGSSAQ